MPVLLLNYPRIIKFGMARGSGFAPPSGINENRRLIQQPRRMLSLRGKKKLKSGQHWVCLRLPVPPPPYKSDSCWIWHGGQDSNLHAFLSLILRLRLSLPAMIAERWIIFSLFFVLLHQLNWLFPGQTSRLWPVFQRVPAAPFCEELVKHHCAWSCPSNQQWHLR